MNFQKALWFNSDRQRQFLLRGLVVFLSLVFVTTSYYWTRDFFSVPPPSKMATLKSRPQPPDLNALKHIFGGGDLGPSTRIYLLIGVLAELGTQRGVALIGVDGSAPRPVSQGEELVPGVTVAEIHATSVVLSENGVMRPVALPQASTFSAEQMQIVR